jgi:ribosomal protein L3
MEGILGKKLGMTQIFTADGATFSDGRPGGSWS